MSAVSHAAAPVVEARATTQIASDGTTHTITRATVAAGQLQFCSASVDDNTTGLTWPGTFAVQDTVVETGHVKVETALEVMSGGEASTFTLTTSNAQKLVVRCWAISGAATTIAADASNSEPGTVTTIDPVAISGLPSNDYLYISTVGWDQWKTVSTFPSGYTQTGYIESDFNAGAATLGWAELSTTASTGSDPSAFSISTSADQAAVVTTAFAPAATTPTLTLSDATPDIDTTVTATLSGAFGAGGNPTTATLSTGDTVACSSATSTTCQFPLNYSALVASGDLGATKLQTALTVTVTNGTETSQSTAINIQIPASGYAIVDLTCTAGTDCTADSEAIVPMIAGDDCAIKVLTGTLDQLSTHCAPVFLTSSFSYIVARFDESAVAWLAQETAVITAPVKGTPKLKIKGVRMGQ